MSPTLFNNKAKDIGLYLRGVGLSAVHVLRSLRASPYMMDFTPTVSGKKAVVAANGRPPEIAALIRHGLARLRNERDGYEVTERGIEYLAQVEAAITIPTEEEGGAA